MAAILIIDDDDVTRFMMRRVVERGGYEVVEAEGGEAAIAKLEQGLTPDCVVLDLMMPRVGGVDVLRRMRGDERLRDVPVMLMTALDDGTEVQQARAMGIGRHFVKAYWHVDDLLTAIAHVAHRPTEVARAAETN